MAACMRFLLSNRGVLSVTNAGCWAQSKECFSPHKMSRVSLMRFARSFQYMSNLQLTGSKDVVHQRLLSPQKVASTIRPIHLPKDVIEKVVPPLKTDKAILSKVNDEMMMGYSRLFAVVAISRSQFKVTPGDLIQINSHLEADVGERIRLEKILLVAGDNFTVIGTPIIDLSLARVEATVIEKTHTHNIVHFKKVQRKRHQRYKELNYGVTVLRINTIEVNPKLS